MMSLLFNMLSRFVITFLPRSKRLLTSQQQSPPTVILEPKKIKSLTLSIVPPSICHEVMGPDAMIFVFLMLNLMLAFPLSSSTFIKRLFSSSSLDQPRQHIEKQRRYFANKGLSSQGYGFSSGHVWM